MLFWICCNSSRSNRRLTSTRVPDPNSSRSRDVSDSHPPRDLEVYKCVICDNFHGMRFCRKFLRMSPQKRREVVGRLGYCMNCLARSHNMHSCTSMDTCRKCNHYHHTLLHLPSHRDRNHPRRSTHTRRSRSRTSRQQQQNQQQRQQQNESSQQQNQPPQQLTKPDTRIIAAAIQSLATVLCTTGN